MSSSPDEYADAKAAGNAAYLAGNTQEAISLYTTALKQPTLASAGRATLLCNRAQCYLKLGDNTSAVEDCTACLTLSPENLKALFRRRVCSSSQSSYTHCYLDKLRTTRYSPPTSSPALDYYIISSLLLAPTRC